MTDARLAPAAAAVWATCLVTTAAPGWGWAAGFALLTLLMLGVTLVTRPSWAAAVLLVLAAAVVAATGVATHHHVRGAGPLVGLTERGAVVDLTARVVTEPREVASRFGEDRRRAVVAVETVSGRGGHGTATARVLLLAGPELATLTVGHHVAVTARLGPTAEGEEEVALAVALGPVRELRGPGPVDAAVARVRAALMAATADLPADAAGLVPGLAVGDTTRLPEDLAEAMRITGLTHVTAVSGGHFAVLFLAVVALTSGLPRPVRALVTVVVMGAFVLVVRPDPPVLRAGAMGLVAVLGTLLGRPSRAVPALGASVLVLLITDPWLARSLGFALSVAATAAIVLVAPALTRAWERRVPRLLAQALAVPIAAQVACAPLLVPLDSGVGSYAVPANLLAAPALVPGTLLGVAAAAVAPFAPGPAAWLGAAGTVPAWWIATVARTFAALPGARVAVPDGPWGIVLVALGGAGAVAALLWAARAGIRALLPAGLVAVALVVALAPARAPGEWVVAQCDVGQGDMLVMRSGPHTAVVVDVGPEPDAADACLRHLDVRGIDLLVLSHHHLDHVGGLAGALRGRSVGTAVLPAVTEPAVQAREVSRLLAEVPVVVGHAGLGGTAGTVRWRVLAPGPDPGTDVNDASVVVHLAGELGVLALGDLSGRAQDALVPELAGLRIDVVKVAHHGARDQSDRLAGAAAPAVALIGVGENDYGHPTTAALDLLDAAGALVLRTDRCGTVVLTAAPAANCAG